MFPDLKPVFHQTKPGLPAPLLHQQLSNLEFVQTILLNSLFKEFVNEFFSEFSFQLVT